MRYSLLILFFIFWGHSVFAQNVDFELTGIVGNPVISPLDVAFDKTGNIYLVRMEREDGSTEVIELDSNGKFLNRIKLAGTTAVEATAFLELDKAGNFYISDYPGACVLKFNPKGEPLLRIGAPGTGPGMIKSIGPIALDERENVYVADKGIPRVQQFNALGQLLRQFGPGSSATDSLHQITDMDLDASGHLYVLDKSERRIPGNLVPQNTVFKFAPSGELLQKFDVTQPDLADKMNQGHSMVVTPDGNCYIVYSATQDVQHFSPEGKLVGKFAAGGNPYSSLRLSQDAAGHIFVIENYYDDSNIRKYATDGTLLQRIGSTTNIGSFAFDQFDNLFLFDKIKREIHQYDAAGNLKLAFSPDISLPAQGQVQELMTLDRQGNIYVLTIDNFRDRIKKFDSKGIPIREFTPDLPRTATTVVGAKDFNIDLKGIMHISDIAGNKIHQVAPDGRYLGAFGKTGTMPGELNLLGSVVFDGLGFMYVQDLGGNRIQKFTGSGSFLMTNEGRTPGMDANFSNLSVDNYGNAFLGYKSYYTTHVRAFDRFGKLQRQLPIVNRRIAVNREGDALAAQLHYGAIALYRANNKKSQGHAAYISGNIFQDPNGNCKRDAGEKALPGIPVKAEPGPFFGYSDEAGNYVIAVDTGRYAVSPILPRAVPGKSITATCPPESSPPVIIPGVGSFVNGPDFGHQVSLSPILQVAVTSNRRRRCFRNITAVTYSNTGFATAANAQVTVQLPEYVSFISANFPHAQDARGNYLFAVGDLQPNQQGTITLIDSVSCGDPNIRNLTVCTKAWITPVNAYPVPAGWNRADISVTGKTLEGGQARFVIRNLGGGDMTDSLQFRVYQDAELALVNKYKLAASDSLVLRFKPTGRVVRVEVDQAAGHPLKASAGANVELKLRAAMAQPASAMMAYPPDDPEPEIAQDCRPIIDSFDPNDKQVVPLGLTDEHFTPTNSPLRYTIRFQNTGTDFAYRVAVVDTLSADLDLSTLQVGAVSHAYRLAVSGKEKPVLTFTFPNMMLPDSAHDLAGSNGFVQFSIRPKPNLPEKVKIGNFADIFFDYNEPIRTNTTINRIYDMPLEVHAEKQLLAREIIATPAVYHFSPIQGRIGSKVTLQGLNFGPEAAGNEVSFNGVPTPVLKATDSTLTVLVPANALSGRIKVVTPDGSVKSSSDYTIFQPPTFTAASTYEAVPGTAISLTGTHFSAVAAQDTVTFNGVVAKVLEASETTLKVEVPHGATLGPILVKTLGGQSESAQPFMIWYPPAITDWSPGKGKAGAAVILTGHHFAENAARNEVQIGDLPAEVKEASAGRLLVKVPPHAQSGKIRVQTPGGAALTSTDFTFIPAPEITSFTPGQGNAGTIVTLTGRHFNADGQADTVYFNGLPARILRASDTVLEVQAPKRVESGPIMVAGAGGRAVAAGFQVPLLAPVEAIMVYPNPTKAGVTINWFKANFTVERMEVYNAIGKLVAERNLKGVAHDEQGLVLASFGPGVYTIRIHTSAGIVVKQVVAL